MLRSSSAIWALLALHTTLLVTASHPSQSPLEALASHERLLQLAEIFSVEPSQGVYFTIPASTCVRQYIVASPQYAVYVGLASGTTVQHTQHCPSAHLCTGEQPKKLEARLTLTSTATSDEDSPSYQVALQLLGALKGPAPGRACNNWGTYRCSTAASCRL